MENTEKENLVLIGAKVKPKVKEIIDQFATSDDRSVSNTISRLLETHPQVAEELAKVSAIEAQPA